ncbi:hypothetical protein ACLB2K_016648 [Fragaria x ananassa]
MLGEAYPKLAASTGHTASHKSVMASVSAPTSTPHNLTFPTLKSYPSSAKSPFYPSSSSRFCLCRCRNPSSDSVRWRWDSALQDLVKTAMKRLDSYVNSNPQPDEEPGWDWDRWRQHFLEVEEEERLVSILKAQLGRAVNVEDFDDAARLKVAIAAASTNDVVGRVISRLNTALQEERYQEAAFFRDNAAAGLVGWWAGISKDNQDPHGLIIRVTAEHGRYAELATAAAGVPLFEIFLTVNKKGEYRQQAVYLKRGGVFPDFPQGSSKAMDTLNPLDSTGEKNDVFLGGSADTEDGDDLDLSEGLSGFQSILRDMIPNVKVKVLKVTAPGKVDRDLISKVIEQIIEEDDEDKDDEIENSDAEDEDEDEEKVEGDQEIDVIELDADPAIIQNAGRQEIAVKVVFGGLGQKISNIPPSKNLLRVPAKIEKKGRSSFSFTVEKDINQQHSRDKEQSSGDKKVKLGGQPSIDNVMFDLSKVIGREKIPLKVLKDVGELINLTLKQDNNHQPLSGSTTFNRIEMPVSQDPLNGELVQTVLLPFCVTYLMLL